MANQDAAEPSTTPLKAPAWENFQMKRLPMLRSEIDLYNFQQYTIHKTLMQRIFVIGLSTGLGKTVCAFSAYLYYHWTMLRTQGVRTKLLVCTNKSAVLQFRSELDKFFTHDLQAASVFSGMEKGTRNPEGVYDAPMRNREGKRLSYGQARTATYEAFGRDAGGLDVMVMNYATFNRDSAAIHTAIANAKAAGFHFVAVFDEATVFKSLESKTHHAVRATSLMAERVIGLTATLTKGKLEEIYGICRGLGLDLATSPSAFEQAYCDVWVSPKNKAIRKIRGYRNIGEFIKLLAPFSIMLRKIDVAKFLPPFILRTCSVEHSDEQYRLISDIYSGAIDPASYGEGSPAFDDEVLMGIEAPEPINIRNPFARVPASKLVKPSEVRKVASLGETGFIKRALMDSRLVTNKDCENPAILSPKTEELMRLLEDELVDEKVIIYTPSKRYLHMVRRTIEQSNRTPEKYRRVLEVSGDIKQQDREDAKNLFQTSPDHNLIMITDAGVESINLQAASILVVMSMPSSGGNMVQLAGRLSRIGSTHSKLQAIFMLTADSQDMSEYLIIHQQMQLMALVMGEAERGLIDWAYIRAAAAERDGAEDVSEAELQSRSMRELLLHRRGSRSAFYGVQATKLVAEHVAEIEEAFRQ
jgi:superfamily II DNA or RNA helicase